MRWIFLLNLARLLSEASKLGIQVICFTFYRSPEDQAKEYAVGRSRTLNGYHPLWLAVDLAIVDDKNKDGVISKNEIRFEQNPRYITLGQVWESLGGTWGGRWKSPHDIYHFEWSVKLKP